MHGQPRSFVQAVTSSGTRSIWDLSIPQPDGRVLVCKLSVYPAKEHIFRRLVQDKPEQTILLEDYGEVLEARFE